jgi:uncharacterized membrane protein
VQELKEFARRAHKSIHAGNPICEPRVETSKRRDAMKTALVAYAGSFATLLVLDAIWLGLVARTFYRDQLGELMLPQPAFGIAALFYLFFAVAVVVLAVLPAVNAASLGTALAYGAILGLAAYGTYDITNLSTLKNWPVTMSLVDMAWGTFVTAATAAGGYAAARAFG